MQSSHKRNIKNGEEFNHFFPVPLGNDIEIKSNASLDDTLDLISEKVRETLSDTAKIAKYLLGSSPEETCSNIWHFVYHHIQYQKDEEKIEQVRRPARSWQDRKSGVDCDCYTVFISSILSNLDLPHILRVTKYENRDYFQHIYPIVPLLKGGYITIDCVVDSYNYEVPFTKKKDHLMKLHYLNGTLDENIDHQRVKNVDTHDLMGIDLDSDLGKINLKKIGTGVKKALHVVNRINPATALIRNGVLASLKLNLMKVAGKIRYAYLSDEKIKEKNLDVSKVQKLKTVLKKLEEVFYGAGGKPENIKKAILTGKGNRDNQVNGLGFVLDHNSYNENTPLETLLSDVYSTEEMEGLGSLGEPVTGAAIAAASSAMALIAGLIKQIGGLKKDGSEVDSGEEGSSNEIVDISNNESTSKSSNAGSSNGEDSKSEESKTNKFLEKASSWVKENKTQAGVLAICTGAAIYFGVKHFSKKKPSQKSLSGTVNKYHKKRKKSKATFNKSKKTIALL